MTTDPQAEVLRKQLMDWKPGDELPDPNKNYDEEYLNLDDLAKLPEPSPIIDGVLVENSLAILRGRDHSFKSFVALDWSLSIASGKTWQRKQTSSGKVLYIAGEGAYGIGKRVRAWRTEYPEAELESRAFTLRKRAFSMFKGSSALEDLLHRVEQERYKLVVFDTLRRISGEANQNSSDMGVIVDNLDKIKVATSGGAVLVVAHTDKGDNDTRGFSGIEDDIDIVWHAERKEGATSFTLKNTKMKDGPESKGLELSVKAVENSLVITQQAPEYVNDSKRKLTDIERAVLKELISNLDPKGLSYDELAEMVGTSKSSVRRACSAFMGAGWVVNANAAGGRGQTSKIVLVSAVRELIKNPEDIDRIEAERGVFGWLGNLRLSVPKPAQ